MRRGPALAVGVRLALAMGGIAIASVAVATLLSGRGLEQRLADSARERLATSAEHTARLAAGLYAGDRRWSRRDASELRHAAETAGLKLALVDVRGRQLIGPVAKADAASAPVEVRGERVGTVAVAQPGGGLLTEQDRSLRSRLDRLHLIAALVAAGLGIAAAAGLAASLTRPLRRLTRAARRMERGQLEARAPETGGGTEVEELARALNRLAGTLQREEELRRSTVADVAHELRTPVHGLLSRIEAAQDGVMRDERRNLDAMHTETLRLARLIGDLQRLAEAQRPGLTLTRMPLDLAELAARRADGYEHRFRSKGIGLQRELASAAVDGDAERLEQVIDNLLSNALRYTNAGGRVIVRTYEKDGASTLEVADNGVGIASEALPHVFTRFWREDRSRARATGGAGIGLAVAHELVRAHGGEISVESEPARGSTFRLTLPGTAGHGSP